MPERMLFTTQRHRTPLVTVRADPDRLTGRRANIPTIRVITPRRPIFAFVGLGAAHLHPTGETVLIWHAGHRTTVRDTAVSGIDRDPLEYTPHSLHRNIS